MERPPLNGAGSGASAWRAYAAEVTSTPVATWANLTRDEVVELLDSEGTADAPAAKVAARPQWMVPTAEGMVPESSLPRR